ncbi:MAG: cation transporter [Thermodesulfovibrionales bacterium]|nr:cation transporter [Thermodesulfovibrionales bacterium]
MKTLFLNLANNRTNLYKFASKLALFTILYNILEGLFSVFFGLEDETIALFGFGVDSFVEVISGVGIWHMIQRLRQKGNDSPDLFEQRALKITGISFYILTVGLIITAIVNLYQGHKPESTMWGVIISLISIFMMGLLIHYKVKVGKELNSQAILSDANCTKACMYLSIVLFFSSIGYEFTKIGGIDSIGAIGIALFSFKEGKESFKKAKGILCSCDDGCH